MAAELIDTHAHLDDEQFAADLPEVLRRATAVGVSRVIAVATTAASSRVCVELTERYTELRATVGVHPNHTAEAVAGDWDAIVALAARPEVVALGETGLDRYRDYSPFAMQEEWFARHLELSRRTGKPVVIHCREAEADVLRLLRADFDRHGPVRGVLHSFSADLATAQSCLEMGLYISFAGMLTYRTAQLLREVAAQMPLDRVLVETDSPYLAPTPVRGKRNEPAYVMHTAATLAGLHGIDLDTLAAHTTRNARTLFGM